MIPGFLGLCPDSLPRTDWSWKAAQYNTLGAGTGVLIAVRSLSAVEFAADDHGLLDSGSTINDCDH